MVVQSLSAAGLLRTARAFLATIPDKANADIPLVDHLTSGLALFGLKYPSLLLFDQDRDDEMKRANLRTLCGIERAPSDTWFRQRLDRLEPEHLCPLYKALFAALQRGKGLEGFAHLDGPCLLSLDGTGYFSSRSPLYRFSSAIVGCFKPPSAPRKVRSGCGISYAIAFDFCLIPSSEALYRSIIDPPKLILT